MRMTELNRAISDLNYFVLQLVVYIYLCKQNDFLYSICRGRSSHIKICSKLSEIFIFNTRWRWQKRQKELLLNLLIPGLLGAPQNWGAGWPPPPLSITSPFLMLLSEIFHRCTLSLSEQVDARKSDDVSICLSDVIRTGLTTFQIFRQKKKKIYIFLFFKILSIKIFSHNKLK